MPRAQTLLLALVALMAFATMAYAERPRKLLQVAVSAPFANVGTGNGATNVNTPWARIFTRPDGSTAVNVPGIFQSFINGRH
ncbi:hypothetical protein Rsub_00311 [Raphidocelis subcapitata]|uniref:Uncharacterized protein n=1 Tax=Raphidocelis subcapitata TaxID=307507 RepID=A0A2V0NQ13_9CHLO|nr:hypothetical protein Rsub_00311 [Raphidocelis subcapitata]|eukprot:GBF87600.1 hypothetical protein Rsub_00311 [Raphidocelis subcapitata]